MLPFDGENAWATQQAINPLSGVHFLSFNDQHCLTLVLYLFPNYELAWKT